MQKHTDLFTDLKTYSAQYPSEHDAVTRFKLFLEQSALLSPAEKRGHLTGSSWIVNLEGDKTLLTHHRKLNLWLQLGGHLNEGEGLIDGASREAAEESGLNSIELLSSHIFDIDAHIIPERKTEKEHVHYDIRYLFRADSSTELKISKESKDLKWVPLSDLEQYNQSPSILRMRDKYIEMRRQG